MHRHAHATAAAAIHAVEADRRPCFEQLEPRSVFDGADPQPGDGNDYIFLAAGHDDSVEAVQPLAVPAQVQRSADAFQWLDGTHWGHVADASNGAVKYVHVNGQSMYPVDANGDVTSYDYVDESRTRWMARWVSDLSDTLVIDIEHWPIDLRFSSREAVDGSIRKFKDMIGWIRDERPALKVAVYGMFSHADQYRSTAMDYTQQRALAEGGWWSHELINAMDGYAKWQAANEYLRPIAEDVDFIAPSLYTRTGDLDLWTRFAISTIDDSMRFGKPVIPFVWHRYHNAMGTSLAYQEIDETTWRHQLNVIREHADGMVLWTDYNYSTDAMWVSVAEEIAANDVASSVGSLSRLSIDLNDEGDDNNAAAAIVDLLAA